MMKPGTPCRHCGSPAKGHPCWYERASFEKHDPPCQREDRADARLTQRRRESLATFVAGLCIVVSGAVIWLVFKGN